MKNNNFLQDQTFRVLFYVLIVTVLGFTEKKLVKGHVAFMNANAVLSQFSVSGVMNRLRRRWD